MQKHPNSTPKDEAIPVFLTCASLNNSIYTVFSNTYCIIYGYAWVWIPERTWIFLKQGHVWFIWVGTVSGT